MSVPGGNLLNLAMSVIAKQQMTWTQYVGRTAAENGDWVPEYAAGIPVAGSIQPIKRSLYEHMGLDFQKAFYNIFLPNKIIDVRRAAAGDLLMYGCKTFSVVSTEPWFQMDGWDQCLCVEVPAY